MSDIILHQYQVLNNIMFLLPPKTDQFLKQENFGYVSELWYNNCFERQSTKDPSLYIR